MTVLSLYNLLFIIIHLISSNEGKINSCGCAPVKYTNRIINGFKVKPRSLKYQVYLYVFTNHNSAYTCGGSILNERYILTAAHCVVNDRKNIFDANSVHVFIGLHNTCSQKELDQCRIKVKKLILHNDYDLISTRHGIIPVNDIALIKTSSKIKFNKRIQPACLPTSSTLDYTDKTGINFNPFFMVYYFLSLVKF